MGSFQAKQFSLHVTRAYTLLISRPWEKINRDQIWSKFNLSTIAPVGEGLNLKEQTITVCGEQRLFLIWRLQFRSNLQIKSCQNTLEDCLLKT